MFGRYAARVQFPPPMMPTRKGSMSSSNNNVSCERTIVAVWTDSRNGYAILPSSEQPDGCPDTRRIPSQSCILISVMFPFETFEHTADTGYVVRGSSLRSLFCHGAEALYHCALSGQVGSMPQGTARISPPNTWPSSGSQVLFSPQVGLPSIMMKPSTS